MSISIKRIRILNVFDNSIARNAPTETKYIVACQKGGVSNKPSVLQAATRHSMLIL